MAAKPPVEKLYFPSFAICPMKRFKDGKKPMLTMEEYDDNSYDPLDLGVTIDYSFFKNIETKFKREILRTGFFGKCLYYEMEEKVVLNSFLTIPGLLQLLAFC